MDANGVSTAAIARSATRQENILSLNANRLFKFASRAQQAQGEMGGFKKQGRCVIEEGAWQAWAFR
jgi:hypothetical protein